MTAFFVPGVGQFYNGKFWRGIFWLLVTPGLWLWSAGFAGWVCHVIAAYTAKVAIASHPAAISVRRSTSGARSTKPAGDRRDTVRQVREIDAGGGEPGIRACGA